MVTCAECGTPISGRSDRRFCGGACRMRWQRAKARLSRITAEPSAGSRAAALDLVMLIQARQAGKITAGQFALAAVQLIGTRFPSVHEALIALGELAEPAGRGHAAPAHDEEHV